MIPVITGHRPNKLGGYSGIKATKFRNKIYEIFCEILLEHQPEYAITGMALGVDQFFAEACIDSNIPFVAAIPCINQDFYWPYESRKHYGNLLIQAKEIYYVSSEPFTPWCMQKRNEYMVNRGTSVWAVWNGTPGGSKNCIDYAKKVNKPVFNIWEKISYVLS